MQSPAKYVDACGLLESVIPSVLMVMVRDFIQYFCCLLGYGDHTIAVNVILVKCGPP